MRSKYCLVVLCLAIALTACTADSPSLTGVVIMNARVIDGSGSAAREAAVRIVGERITAVGSLEPAPGDSIFDANGLVLAPGFIDSHSHHDDGLSEMPEALAAVNQGITTIVVGQDGGQPFPLADFFDRLEKSPVAINVASFAGHGTLRRQVMADDYRRTATSEEVSAMRAILQNELAAGALGLSTGLEYDPGSFASTEELVTLAREAADHGGRYTSHIRSEDQFFWEAIDEAIVIGREARIPVRVTHIKLAMTRWWGQSDRLLSVLDAARDSGVDLTADVYPSRAWYAGFSWLATLFPARDLTRREGADYILNDMLAADRILIPVFQPDPSYNGMTIAEIAALRESDSETTLMELLQADAAVGGADSGSEMLAFAMHEPDIEKIMAWPHTVIASDGDAAGAHPRGYSAFTRFLGHYVRDRKVASLEEGIRKITSLPAQQVGIAERGLITEGYYADLVLFDPATVSDRATFTDPHVTSAGIEKVWVNGQLVYDGGTVTGNRPGKPIQRRSSVVQ